METTRFEYRVPSHLATAVSAEKYAWERLGAELALVLSHQLADDQYRILRAHKDFATDYRTHEKVWSITLEIAGDRQQQMLADVRDRIDGINSSTLRRNPNQNRPRPVRVARPTAKELAEIEAEAPRPVRRILMPTITSETERAV